MDKMKILRIILLAITIPNFVFGQDKPAQSINGRLEIGAGAGVWSSDYMFDGYTPGILGMSKKDYINHQYSGAYHLNIKYFASEKLSINIIIAYEKESGDWQAN